MKCTIKTLMHAHWALCATLPALLLGSVSLGDGRALAEDVSAGDEPPVRDAVVEVDAEVNTWLTRAMTAMRAGSPDNALPLLLHVLRSAPDVMASTNGVTYQPARKLAIKLIRALPERTVAAYRIREEVSTRGFADRSPPSMDVATLDASYRTGLPDAAATEAGMRLAGLYLDQERFAEARRVLFSVLDESRVTRAQRPELLARLVVACARVGDLSEAEWAWAELQKSGDTKRWSSLGAELRPVAPPPSNSWTMAYGGPAREASPATLSAPDFGANEGWILRWGLSLGAGVARDGTNAASGPTNLPPQFSLSRTYAAACMLDKNLRPADQPVFDGNRAWVNGLGELAMADLDSGRVLQRTAHAGDPDPDPAASATVFFNNVVVQFGGQARTSSGAAESWVFANRLNRAVSLTGGRVYCIEDNPRASRDRDMPWQPVMINRKWVTVPQPRGNVMAAYAADTGQLLWRIGREPQGAKPEKARKRWRANAIRFLAAPVPCAGLLIAPVEDDSGLSVVGLDADNGAPVWRTWLAYGGAFAAPRAAPVTVTVVGAHAYLCGGNGSVSALDGYDGSVLWTTFYESFDGPSVTNRVNPGAKSDTWEESLVQVAGETVVALPEDSADVLAFDRRNGTRLWTRRKPEGVDYVVGRRGAALIVAGGRTAACVDLADGRERWRKPIAGSTGRGTLCGQEALIPCGQTILRLRAEDGMTLGSMWAQRMDDLPLGNLYVNGDQLLVAGPERLYALVDARQALARMAERLARQPTAEAYAERGQLYVGVQRYVDAVADLREAWRLRRGSAVEESARGPLMTTLWRAAEQDSGAAKALHDEACALAVTASERAESAWRLAQYRERNGDTKGALVLYAAIVADSDAMIPPALSNANWEVSARRLAASRIRVLDREDAKGPAYLEKEAAQALARLGPAAEWTALVEMATIFSGTIAGKDAALKAAQLAADRGDLGTAEAVLQRALALARPSERVAVAEAMVQLYERMKWPRGVLRLRDDWSRLFAGAHPPELLDRASARAAQRTTAMPPWRLRWQNRLPTNNVTAVITPAGLSYWTQDLKPLGCLALDTGLPRWQKAAATNARVQWGGQTSWEDSHIVSIFVDGGFAFLDLWSGAVTTNAPLRIETANAYPVLGQIGIGNANAYPVFGQIGMAAVGSRAGGGVLTSADVLTGQVVWRRKEMELLQGAGVLPTPLAYASVGVFLMRCAPDGNAAFVTLDPWTGGVAFSRPVTANGNSLGLMASQGGMWSLAFPRTPEREVPVIADGRLSVRDRRTGVVLWTTPPDMVIAKSQTLLSGSVLVQTADEESVLFDGANGRIMCRSQGVRFACDYARQGEVGDAVIMSHRAEGGTNDVMVLDPAVNRIAFQGRLPQQMQPALFLGPAAPNQLLVSENGHIAGNDDQILQSLSIQVVNERGENINGWRLPRRADLGDGPRSFGRNIILAEGVIVIVDPTSGDVLAYEHDPGGMAKNP